MGHLLKSINPDAAEAIQPAPAASRLPGVGEIVIYHMRTGHGRQGRTRFPAIVQEPGIGGQTRGLSLTVIMEAGELVNQTLVEEIGPGKDGGHVWERPDLAFVAESLRNLITSAHTRIGELEAEMAALRKLVLGDFDEPKISIIGIMVDFENRLRNSAAGKKRGK